MLNSALESSFVESRSTLVEWCMTARCLSFHLWLIHVSSFSSCDRPADIAIVRKLRKPPNLIQRIMDCVLLLQRGKVVRASFLAETGGLTPSWEDAVRAMGQSNFLVSLMEFDKDVINEEDCELIAPYLEAPDFTFERAKKVSGNVAGLCSWVSAMNTFYFINKAVIPLKDQLRVAEVKLQAALRDLAQAQENLDERQRALDRLQVK